MFHICNIATQYIDCYIKLLIVFCAIFDPHIHVKEEISNERILRTLNCHLWLKPSMEPSHHNLVVRSLRGEVSWLISHWITWFLVSRPPFSRKAGIMLMGYVEWILATIFFLLGDFSFLTSDIGYVLFIRF